MSESVKPFLRICLACLNNVSSEIFSLALTFLEELGTLVSVKDDFAADSEVLEPLLPLVTDIVFSFLMPNVFMYASVSIPHIFLKFMEFRPFETISIMTA